MFSSLLRTCVVLCAAVKITGHKCGLIDKVTSDLKIEGLNPFVVFGGAFFLNYLPGDRSDEWCCDCPLEGVKQLSLCRLIV